MESYTCDAGLSEADYNIGEGDLSHIQYCNIEAVVTDLPRHSYYNVCAELRLPSDELRLASTPVMDSQCMILHSNTIVRYQTRFGNYYLKYKYQSQYFARSVLSLLLTLIFLSLGIACLTVLYLIVRRRQGRKPSLGDGVTHRRLPPGGFCGGRRLCTSVSYLLSYWRRLAEYKKNKLVDDFSDDEGI